MSTTAALHQCTELIHAAQTIGALTGAGISTSAGIPDFRGPKGLYVTRQYDPETIFDIDYFCQDPKPFYAFGRDFVGLEEKLKPTTAHCFLSALENKGKLAGIVTQNIDSLHHKAGSKNIYEMHGSFWQSFCLNCGREFSYSQMKEKLPKEHVPHCPCGGVIKPDIVFFGENVKYLDEVYALARQSDLFFVIGTSCAVYPAATLPALVPGKIIIVNQGEVHLDVYNIALEVQEDIDLFFTRLARKLKMKL